MILTFLFSFRSGIEFVFMGLQTFLSIFAILTFKRNTTRGF